MHEPLTPAPPLRRFFDGLCPSQTPGYAWSVTGSAGRLAFGWGGARVLAPALLPVEEGTLFDLASLTKPLATTLVALRAWDRGLLDIEAPLAGASSPPFSALDLLRHQGGFPAWLPLYARGRNGEDLFHWLLARCPRTGSGEAAVYSCPGFVLLGLILERFLHAPLSELFAQAAEALGVSPQEACFAPSPGLWSRCAATETGGQREAEMARQFGASLPGYPDGWEGAGVVNDGNARHLGGVAGNAGLFGTLRGVELLARAFSREERFLSERALDLVWTPRPLPSGELRTAGWKAAGSPGWRAGEALAPGSIGHEGYTGTGIWLERASGRSYILLTNRVHPAHPGTDFGPSRAAFLRAAKESA
jgi:CubicO group peptidase (beta-lactamase class C family)